MIQEDEITALKHRVKTLENIVVFLGKESSDINWDYTPKEFQELKMAVDNEYKSKTKKS